MDNPGSRQGIWILENRDGVVPVDAGERPTEPRRDFVSGQRCRHHDVAHVERVQQWRIETALEDVGVVVVLCMPVQHDDELVVASDVHRVVALSVVQARKHGTVVDLQ